MEPLEAQFPILRRLLIEGWEAAVMMPVAVVFQATEGAYTVTFEVDGASSKSVPVRVIAGPPPPVL